MAEEGRYRFGEAEKAYSRAVKLEPKNPTWREHYDEILKKINANGQAQSSTVVPMDRRTHAQS